jgi:hypothetical protein
MTNVTRIRRGPHLTPRPEVKGTTEVDGIGFDHVAWRISDRAKMVAATVAVSALALVGYVAITSNQSDPIPGKSPQPTAADYEAHEDQPLNGS